MSKYKITESVGDTRQNANSYEDLEIHHPSANARGLRTGRTEDFEAPSRRRHERVDGDFEEVKHTRDGGLLVKKDFILTRDGNGPVTVPAPIAGYVHYTHDRTATVQIFEQPNGQGKLLAQVLHMETNSFTLREGARVEYGQPLGTQGDTGSPNSVHCHIEVNVDQFRKYISDIASGTISPDSYPARGSVQEAPATTIQAGPLTDGVLKKGEHGHEIAVLQTQLNALGFKDAKGNALVADGDFGDRTKQAVEAFQRSCGLVDDGLVGKDTLAALKNSETVSVAPTSQQVAPARNDHAPLLSHPNHPDHALYQQALAGIEKLPASTFRSEQERQNAAASVALDAKVSGLSRVDTVALSTNGSGLFAVQGAMSDPAHNRVYIDKTQAETQSVEKSTQQLQQESLLSAHALQTHEHQKKSMAI